MQTVDDYIESFSGPAKEKLIEMRKLVMEEVPNAKEKISYRMPGYFLKTNIIYFAAFSKHIGIYPGIEAVESFNIST